jgi:hypothetical protein
MKSLPLAMAATITAWACNQQAPRREGPAPEPVLPSLEPPSSIEQSNEPALPALCLLAGADIVEREDSFTDIAFGYYARTDDCQSRRLINRMGDLQTGDWLNYLINYSHAFFGCGLLFDPLPGGVDAFGLANTEAVGIPNPRLGADDVALLIDLFLSSCTDELSIPSADRAQLRARLESAAQPQIDPTLTAALSECP